MKITKATTLVGTRLHEREDQWITDRYRSVKADIAVVIIETDGGLAGIGEACAYGNPLQIADWVEWYAPSLIGADVDDLGIVPSPTGSAIVHAVGSAHDFAVAGIDCALWDLRGKQSGVSVSRLIDAAADSSVDVYASGGVRYDWRADPRTLIDEVVGHVAAGYSAVKIRLGTYWGWDAVTPERFLRLFDDVRREVGPDLGIAVDGNSRLTRAEALTVARGLDERGALWFEEPIAKDDLDGYVELNRSVGLKITGGESFTTLEQFRPWIERGAFDIVQPDAGVCGITELLKIGRFADRAGLELVPHSWHNGLMAMANAHAVAALPNASMLEECMVQGPLKWSSLVGGSRVDAGRIDLGEAAGFGVALINDLETRFPYIEGHYAVEVFRREHAA
ncbi:mandelate racemase/muconate lactonizing enzyme family protein [Microbacterium luteolum]|uniref:Mandelate racemase/muconate lactonizing enzyme family protein n=1 Tax=Microbacterium luteolum TaxID=69367 RepID=A0ABY7XSV3_MICLT|nr:mandelate racemase/muconate lactonizing enzyme family protein [Microbacterium luteolum]WDM45271.1 mandelate racemase/muconate lactonizing enzyme family protein [Microbacterium luteolum]